VKALIFNIQKFSIHDGAGIRTNVFFQGCNLKCKWCANPESLPVSPDVGQSEARWYTTGELMPILAQDKPFYDMSGGGVTFTGGEPLLQPEFAEALAGMLHEYGISVALETAAHISSEIFARMLPGFDSVLVDLKHYCEEAHLHSTGVSNKLILENIRIAIGSGIYTVIRIPVIPGYNNSAEDIKAFSALLQELKAIRVHLLPFHQLGESKYQSQGIEYAYEGVAQLHDEDLEEFAKILRKAGFEVQIGG